MRHERKYPLHRMGEVDNMGAGGHLGRGGPGGDGFTEGQ